MVITGFSVYSYDWCCKDNHVCRQLMFAAVRGGKLVWAYSPAQPPCVRVKERVTSLHLQVGDRALTVVSAYKPGLWATITITWSTVEEGKQC